MALSQYGFRPIWLWANMVLGQYGFGPELGCFACEVLVVG